jgi:hypothetical protein
MTLDDDSILSAYLDGELGPEQQQAVESALFADPQLADEVRNLALLRDLVAGLPRDVPADVTTRVMRRVRRRAWLRTAEGVIAWGPVRAGLVAAAASLLLAISLPWFLHLDRVPAGGEAPIAQVRPVAEVRPVVRKNRGWPVFPDPAREARSEPPGTGGHPTIVASAEDPGSGQDELVHVRKYLDHPNLRRIFLVSDTGNGSDEQRVASVVEQTTHYNYYKITISQGIVIDPRHPDQATVFALVVGPRDLHRLGDQLRTALKDRVEESDAEPAVVTQLADIGQVEARSPSPAAEMDIPREVVMAIKAPNPGGDIGPPEAPRAELPKPGEPTRQQERSSPRADEADLVVLVWVSRSRPG